ncbi:LytR C-terminal domain-containing protein [Planctomonas sp. JC2975]|uniref:LytR C-terminal domain-containing protein n=1 Tax=Planctomonas sp. JC2975 TaxID=2729626 RepID=UPI0014757E5E|nr:LytR C-terminal domain-containing protein [Planctomonas sp. JC2975]NNC11663.1 LytR C-terminal domain-containing protein [Planctomonas sp. JC2975]
MAQKFPNDRFDQIPDDLERIGAHRAPRPKGYGWIWVAWCAGAVIVIVGLGALAIFAINGTLNVNLPFGHATASQTPTATPTPTPTITPAVNPALNLIVLNGTTKSGLAADATTTLKAAGWQNITPANASSTDVKTTTVYYSDPKNEAAALAVSQELAGAPIQVTQDFAASGADITIVLGDDYKPTHQ